MLEVLRKDPELLEAIQTISKENKKAIKAAEEGAALSATPKASALATGTLARKGAGPDAAFATLEVLAKLAGRA